MTTEKERADFRSRAAGAERHFAANGLKCGIRESYRGVEFVTAVGGPFRIERPSNEDQRKLANDHPDGFYEYAFVVFKDDKPWLGGFNVIDRYHDLGKGWTENTRERARFNAASREAKMAIDAGIRDYLEGTR